MNSVASLVAQLKSAAFAEGFAQVGVAPAVEPRGYPHLIEWIENGFAGEMHYFPDRQEAYRHPQSIVEGARSVVMLAYPYAQGPPSAPQSGEGRWARYLSTGNDYHDIIHSKLKRLRNLLQRAHPDSRTRGVVDTAPLLERDFARLAGLGWQGKNTLLINKSAGSYFFLAALVTDLVLPADLAHESDHCGTCRRCLDACPTDAFPEPGVLDATRCISYLTIENRGVIPEPLRESVGSWVFGCDVCQEVCPWNRKPARAAESESAEALFSRLPLGELFSLDEASFRERFRKTAVWRAGRRGLLRNAAIVLGNQRSIAALPALNRGLVDDEPLVRGASAWAIGQIGGEEACQILAARRELESDAEVRAEIGAAFIMARSDQRSDT